MHKFLKFNQSIKVNKKNTLEYIDNELKMTDKVYALVNQESLLWMFTIKLKNSNDLSQFSETSITNTS